ncbi:hypothetical protein FSARC_579 [Fusarium sarcochroum]|uniref:Uncharacterized protein n=1 Tax=Fusarium sarcochroum TaxID=1208366 RepID=A0A8H4UBG4_9HYPO|nr:hypothetical protein FSARC_579 [Fusarium sarcochroum]
MIQKRYASSEPMFTLKSRLAPAEVFDAEAGRALEGLKAVLDLRASATQNIFTCPDDLGAASCLRGTPSDPTQDVFLEFRTIATLHGSAHQRLYYPNPETRSQHWHTYGGLQGRNQKKHLTHRGPPPLLCRTRDSISRRPRRCTPGLLTQPTQVNGPHLLLPEDTIAPSDEADTFTESSVQHCIRKRLYQVCRLIRG